MGNKPASNSSQACFSGKHKGITSTINYTLEDKRERLARINKSKL